MRDDGPHGPVRAYDVPGPARRAAQRRPSVNRGFLDELAWAAAGRAHTRLGLLTATATGQLSFHVKHDVGRNVRANPTTPPD